MQRNKVCLEVGVRLLMAITAVWLEGCASSKVASSRIKGFSEATTLVTSNLKEALDITERKYFDVQVQRAVVDYDRAGFHPEEFKPLFSAETRAVRNAVLDSFALYGQKLAAIMGNEQLGNLDAAARTLGTKLNGLSQDIAKTKFFTTTGRSLNATEVAILTTAVEGIASLFLEWKREKSVRQAVSAMDTNVQVVCEALTNDLGVLRRMVANEYREGQRAEDQFILHGELDPPAKRTEIRALAQSVLDQRNADAVLAAMEQTVINWQTAHKELLQVFEPEKTHIDALIQQLAADGTRIKAFYDSLQKQ
jgi:hypothetical protein